MAVSDKASLSSSSSPVASRVTCQRGGRPRAQRSPLVISHMADIRHPIAADGSWTALSSRRTGGW
ncbi:hypothetical protein EYF80_068403 [Liparis tanakae]|uniref:Uncharacterized protein n=1 Tax=Liparis tanakae TaxID=230148 RepID=A0A4Z2DYA7_9TELE|nr:hypothetical protein EYF80_068403 [Liparis tanakae]